MSFPFLTDNRESPGMTFAEPGSTRSVGQIAVDALASIGRTVSDPYVNPQPYADIFHAAERSMRLTGNIASEGQARAEAYDQRIRAVKAATGVDLENPERGGYAIDARRSIAQEVRAGGIASIDAKGGIPEYQRRIFDQKLAELQKDHPELQFGDADAQARALARGATEEAAKATSADVNPVASLVAQFAGGLVGSRRDPLFIGSLFAGPTTAVGRTALARVASSSLFTGLYNAGVSAAEQPTVQDWRARIGVEHGVLPAIQDVGLAFLTGAIPGAGIQAIKESARVPLQRVLAGHPEPGDIAAVHDVVPLAERDRAALHAGEESVAADKATLTIPIPKDVPEPLHNDMLAAALKRADDPAEPSPAAVAAVARLRGGYFDSRGQGARFHGSPSEVGAFDEGFYGSSTNIYGARGFYTTDALDVAHGYANRRGAAAPSIYEVQPKGPHKIFDMEGPIPPELRSELEKMHESSFGDAAEVAASALDENPKSLRAFFDEARGYASGNRIPADEVQEGVFHPIMDYLEAQGFHGMSHRGGLNTKTPEHSVVIYFNPDNSVRLRKMSDRELQGLRQPEIEQRITEAAPKSEAEAHAVADEALDDVGRASGMSALREGMAAADAERAPPAIPPEEPAAVPRARGDVLDKVPWVDEAGRPKLIGAKGAAAVGERETTLSMLVRSCK